MTTALAAEPSEDQILALPTYHWDAAAAGDEAPQFSYTVTREAIATYCKAVRNGNPLYLDETAAKAGPFGRIVAPPTFAIMAAPLRRNEVMHAKGYAAPEEKGEYQTPYVKAEIRWNRPLFPGDTVISRVYLEDKLERRGKRFAQWKVEGRNPAGDPLFDYTYVTIWPDGPGVGTKPETAVVPDPVPEIAAADALPLVTKLESQEAIDCYGSTTKVRPRVGTNLHQDPEFAQRTLFGGTANAGVATLAYCSEMLELGYGPQALLRPGARVEFKAIRPVRAGDEITMRGKVIAREARTHGVELWVHGQDGRLRGVGTGTVVVKA